MWEACACLLKLSLSGRRSQSLLAAQDHPTDDGTSFKMYKTFLNCGRGAGWMFRDTCFSHSIKFALASAQIGKDERVNGVKALFFLLFLYMNFQTTLIFEALDISHIPLPSWCWQCQSNFWAAENSCAGHGCRKLSWAKPDLLESPTSAMVWLRCHRPLVVIFHTTKTVCWQWTSGLRRTS